MRDTAPALPTATRLLGRTIELASRRLAASGRRLARPDSTARGGIEFARLDYSRAAIYVRRDRASLDSINARLRSCAKEPWTVDWIETRLSPGQVLYDVGANVGAYTLVAAKALKGDVQIVAFEPAYATFAALCDNIVANDASAIVRPLPLALAAQTAQASLSYRLLETGAARHSVGAAAAPESSFTPAYVQPILTWRLDDLVERFQLPPPNHLKLDVDGAELDVLHGAKRLLAGGSIESMMIEVDRERADELASFLSHLGFLLERRFDSPKASEVASDHFYGLFSRR